MSTFEIIGNIMLGVWHAWVCHNNSCMVFFHDLRRSSCEVTLSLVMSKVCHGALRETVVRTLKGAHTCSSFRLNCYNAWTLFSDLRGCILQLWAENVDIGDEGHMCGVPTEPSMQRLHDWKDCKCSSIYPPVPYLIRVAFALVLIKVLNPQNTEASCG